MKDAWMYDSEHCPGEGWYWSENLLKWRRNPAPFKPMRAGIHWILGFVAAALTIGWGREDGIWLLFLVTGLFLAYEKWESDRIKDEAYLDIGGYLGGVLSYLGLTLLLHLGRLAMGVS